MPLTHELLAAAQTKDAYQIKSFLIQSIHISGQNTFDISTLHAAIYYVLQQESLEIAALLFKQGVSIDY